jgi:altronate dehydratase
MKDNALRINPADNVAIAIRAIKKGEPVILGGKELFKMAQDIDASHKIALVEIKNGGKVIRYGEPIVQAMVDIGQGEWIHVHNAEPVKGDPVK